MNVIESRNAVRDRSASAVELTRQALDRASAINPKLNAFVELFPDQALDRARVIDAQRERGEPLGALAGVPIALKDNIALSWGKTTCASRFLENYRSPFTATAAQRLIDAGAIIIGKTNLDEFAMGSSTTRSIFGPTRNPYAPDHVVGGSSGGSACAVASGIVPAALGSDTGGSIRQPAGFCNIVGYKPSYGMVSRFGLVAYASSLDQIGPFARTVTDVALLTSVIAGTDPLDSTSSTESTPNLLAEIESPIANLVIGVPRQARSSANHPAVAAALESAVAVFKRAGAIIVDVDLPNASYGVAAYYLIATAEASSNLARFDGVRFGRRAALAPGDDLMALYCRSRAEGFGEEVQRRIMLGTHALSAGYADAYYLTALKVRRLISREYQQAFDGAGGLPACHALLTPSSPSPAWRIGEKSADPVSEYLEDVYTVGVNLAGLPGVTLPGGFAEGSPSAPSLPVGVQLVGPALDDARLLAIARLFERNTDFARRTPNV